MLDAAPLNVWLDETVDLLLPLLSDRNPEIGHGRWALRHETVAKMNMRRTGTRKTRVARLAGPAMAAVGACVLTMVIPMLTNVVDPRPAEASPASQPSAVEIPAASRPQQAGDPATRPVLQARSGIALFYLAHADAQRIAQILQQLFVDEAVAVVSDPRTNCVILSGNALVIERARLLIARLDIPVASRPFVVVVSRPASRSATQAATEPATRPSMGPVTRPAPTPMPPICPGP